MNLGLWFFILVLPVRLLAENNYDHREFFLHLEKLEFDSAKYYATMHPDSAVRAEQVQLVDILFYEGQIARTTFKITSQKANKKDIRLSVLRALNAGYASLFYDRAKGDAYKYFYEAYQVAKSSNESILKKAVLFAFFKYYNSEIVQVTDSYKAHLDQFEKLREDYVDDVWLTIYRMIFFSKVDKSRKLDDQYFRLDQKLTEYEKNLNSDSPVLAHVFYERAVKLEIDNKKDDSFRYFNKVLAQAKNYPFLKDERFASYLKLSALQASRGNLVEASALMKKAKGQINLADTLRSNYLLNLNSSIYLYSAEGKYDSAFLLLKKAYLQEFQMDFRRNTVEINKLSVELETQEKENSNLRLRQDRTWLGAALIGAALLLMLSYFAYANQRSKNRVQLKEREVEGMKLAKVLKDQELFGIDAMISGQEKERQRIANDLHDNLGSLLATVKLHINNLKLSKNSTTNERSILLQTTEDLLDEAYQKVRGIAHTRNAGVYAQDGLIPAVKKFANKVSVPNKLAVNVKEFGMGDRLENSMEITLFRIIQELITNVIKHSGATEATVHLTQYEYALNIMVEDNGIGFDRTQIKHDATMGIYSIEKRVEMLGGSVTIDSIIRKGTTIIIDIPVS